MSTTSSRQSTPEDTPGRGPRGSSPTGPGKNPGDVELPALGPVGMARWDADFEVVSGSGSGGDSFFHRNLLLGDVTMVDLTNTGTVPLRLTGTLRLSPRTSVHRIQSGEGEYLVVESSAQVQLQRVEKSDATP